MMVAERDDDAVECERAFRRVVVGWCKWAGLDGGKRYVVRGRVWRGGHESVSLWSCGVSVVTSGVGWLPRAQRLPALDVGMDVGELRVGRSRRQLMRHNWLIPSFPNVACTGRGSAGGDMDGGAVADPVGGDQVRASLAVGFGSLDWTSGGHGVLLLYRHGSRNGTWRPWARIGV